MDITFIVTCYNEEKNVIAAIETIHMAAAQLGLLHEIIVFDDASSDKTSTVVENYMRKFPNVGVKLHRNTINKGVAHNFVEGAFQGKGEYCRLICGDNTEPEETHVKILHQMGKADLIIPYYKSIKGRTWMRHMISKSFTCSVNFMTGFSIKYYNACPVLKRIDLMRWHVEASGLGYQAELIIRLLRQGKSYVEIEVDGFDRPGSVSFRLKNVLSVCHSLFKIFLSRIRILILK
jgi:glycosyltransferase involved in cell wall biosynthesis